MDNLILNLLAIHKFESHEHLLEVLPLIEEATQRLGSPAATSTWLLTPVSPGGKTPLDYKDYSLLFRKLIIYFVTIVIFLSIIHSISIKLSKRIEPFEGG